MNSENKQKPGEPTPRSPTVVEATQLFDGARELRIRFKDQEYRLRITRNEKLILTK